MHWWRWPKTRHPKDGDDAALVAARAAWGHLFDRTRPGRGARCGREGDAVPGA